VEVDASAALQAAAGKGRAPAGGDIASVAQQRSAQAGEALAILRGGAGQLLGTVEREHERLCGGVKGSIEGGITGWRLIWLRGTGHAGLEGIQGAALGDAGKGRDLSPYPLPGAGRGCTSRWMARGEVLLPCEGRGDVSG
jgi:hypothetical protein